MMMKWMQIMVEGVSKDFIFLVALGDQS
jgi:hypothetical protein